MERVFYALIAVAGVAVVVERRRFVESSFRSSREIFGRDIRPGSREAVFQARFAEVLAVVVGVALTVMSLLGAFGVIWND